MLEIVGLRIGVGLHRGDGAVGDGLDTGIVAGINEVQLHPGIGRLESRLDRVGPEIEDVGIGASVPVDLTLGGKGQLREDHHAGHGASGRNEECATLHRLLPKWPRYAPAHGQTLRRPITDLRAGPASHQNSAPGHARR